MWSNDVQSIVFTRLKVSGTNRLKSKYPNILFTTSSRTRKDAEFPTVYVKKMQGQEIGSDLSGETVNGILASFQIEVSDNKSQFNADNVSDVVSELMKEMRFQIVGEPYTDESDPDIYRNVARYRRIIGQADIL